MTTNLIGSSHYHFEILDSTTVAAMQEIAKARPNEGLVISADAQTAGLGQIGSKWHSEYGKNCLFSAITYPSFLKAENGFYLQMTACNALKKALSKLFPTLDFKIKWPNDLYCEGKKLAGMLIQTSVRGYFLDYAIIGIGINVNQTIFPPEIGNPSSIALLTNQKFSRSLVLSEILLHLDNNYEKLKMQDQSSANLTAILNEFENNLYLYNHWALYQDKNENIMELCIGGVKHDGALILRDRKGMDRFFDFKEIKLLHPI